MLPRLQCQLLAVIGRSTFLLRLATKLKAVNKTGVRWVNGQSSSLDVNGLHYTH